MRIPFAILCLAALPAGASPLAPLPILPGMPIIAPAEPARPDCDPSSGAICITRA